MTERLTDLFIEFDEMGFSPTIPCENLEKAAVEWKEKVIKEIEALISEIDEANEIARHYEAKTWEYTEIICDEKSETRKQKHRAEVAEMALKLACKTIAPSYVDTAKLYFEVFVNQAEKELAEERNDEQD